MLRKEIKRLRSANEGELRKFGLTIGGVLLAVGAWLCLRHKAWWPLLVAPGFLLVVLGVVTPRSLRWIYIGWMTLALVLGTIVSTALLALLFFLVLTPIGLLARLAGKDFLSRRLKSSVASYWIPRDFSRPKERHRHEQQF